MPGISINLSNANKPYGLLFTWLLLLLFSGQTFAWYDNTWHYRIPINVPAGSSVNSTIKVDVDFAAQLTTLGVTGSFDINSPRIVRSDDLSLATNQEYTDAIYAGGTDSTANNRGEIRFILQDAGATTYYLYFDTVANGPKATNSQSKINGNFEADITGTVTPNSWAAASRSDANMDLQIRPAETVSVSDTSSGTLPATVNTNGNPSTGKYSYLLGFRSKSDATAASNTNASITRTIKIPATNPGNLTIKIKPEGWDSGKNKDLSNYDFLQVRLLDASNSNLLLVVVGPSLNNYATCPFSPNHNTSPATNSASGYGPYNYWDNGTGSNNHTLVMTSTFNRGSEPWISCSAGLATVAGKTVKLEIRMDVTNEYRSWFLLDDLEWSVTSASLGTPQTVPVVAPPATGFNAFETATAANSISGVLKTKIAGTAFNFDVVALTSSPATVLTSFTGTVKVELVNGRGASCTTNTAIQTVTAGYTFTAPEQGRHTFSGVSQAQAYPDALVRISYPASAPTVVVCSTDHFAIRPASFVAAASDANWVSAGTTRSLNATLASATPTHKAAQPFTLVATAYNSLGAVTSGYNGTPSANFNSCVLPASGCVGGAFNAGTFVVNNGVATSITAQYSEVGVINATIKDSDFAIIDASDGSTLSERTITSPIFTIGRFVPDHFDVTINMPVFAPSCNTFTYIGQPIKFATAPEASISAKNNSGVVTQNYTGSLWKINPSDTTYGITPSYSEAAQPLTVLNTSLPTTIDNGDGTGRLNFADTTSNILAITRSAPINEFNAEIALSFILQDTDAVQVANINGGAGVNPVGFGAATVGNGISFTGGNKAQRWGRLALGNAYGSELVALSVPLFTEYFNGSSFISNTSDNCTALTLSSQLALSNPLTNSGATKAGNAVMTIAPAGTSQASLVNATLLNGVAGLSFSAPGAGNTGYIDISGNFASMPWLLFDWDNNGVQDNSPTAKATFGIYKGNSKQIYLREVY